MSIIETTKQLLLIDQKSNSLSDTKLRANITFAVASVLFSILVLSDRGSTELWFIYLMFGMLPQTAHMVAKLRYGQGADKTNTEEANDRTKQD